MALPVSARSSPRTTTCCWTPPAALAKRAREEGITSFSALVLAGNEPMLNLLAKLGRVRTVHREQGTVDLTIELPETAVPIADLQSRHRRRSPQSQRSAARRRTIPGRRAADRRSRSVIAGSGVSWLDV
jgi:hypothetical protein